MKRRLVLFDIDGTLLTSMRAGRQALLAAFAEEYVALDFFDTVRFDGKTDLQIISELHTAAGFPERAEGATARSQNWMPAYSKP